MPNSRNKQKCSLFAGVPWKILTILRDEGTGELASRIRIKISLIFRTVLSLIKGRSDRVVFQCNICKARCVATLNDLKRDVPSCWRCGSSVRMRAIVHILSLELFGQSLTLPDFPLRPDITGLGMSDWDGYAFRLSKRLNYLNTFYHKEPQLDITTIDKNREETLDFIISTDVFEHILPPIQVAFKNVFRLLKPGGVLIFSAPYVQEGETVEHFPEINDYKVLKRSRGYLLKNITREGNEQSFDNLIFHGGPGATLEMRRFSESSILKEFSEAKFTSFRIYDESFLDFGIAWEHRNSFPMAARK